MNHTINLKVLTPVHIGMGSEKKMIRGADFVYEEGTYKILNQNKLLSNLEQKDVFAISGYMADGNYDEFTRYIKSKKLLSVESIEYEWESSYSRAFEIRCAFKDGSGNYFMPGSSVKGALRSVTGTALWNGRKEDINYNMLMGNIDNNLMRFLQVTDCYVNEKPGIYPVKVFSADKLNGTQFGSWKDNSRGGHNEIFNAEKFVTYYEMLPDGLNGNATTGTFRINWGTNEFVRKEKRDSVLNIEIFNNPDGIQWLWNAIKSSTDKFLNSEIEFFGTYLNDSINDHFLDELYWLKEENLADENTCILRLGANVGWHTITGNWKFDDFAEAVEQNRGHVAGGRELAYKTRKLGFDGTGENRRFFLPGFVKLALG
jgi:CRISPR/Cas system CSM-associated protein Csm5 (group 7 of RAMP superfamily)